MRFGHMGFAVGSDAIARIREATRAYSSEVWRIVQEDVAQRTEPRSIDLRFCVVTTALLDLEETPPMGPDTEAGV